MPDLPSDEIDLPDGRVGGAAPDAAAAGAAGTTEANQPTLWISAYGHVSDPTSLAEEMRFVIATFLQGLDKGRTARPHAPDPDTPGCTIEIATHGLNLDPADEQELHRVMRQRVRAYTERKKATK